jgi:dihydroflavonol-4-reductase
MRVLVTGGTGFVGSHSVAALQEAGHELQLLVRSRERIARALGAVGVDGDGVGIVEGDAADPRAVARALEGCDAVLHAASVYSFEREQRGAITDLNTAVTAQVLEAAAARGLDPIVYVSSYVALLPSSQPLTERSPVGDPVAGYPGSKAAAEHVARGLQDRGAPVVIVYPGVVIGPHDPYVGESTRIILNLLRQRRPPTTGVLPLVDVRDVAAAHVAAMQPGRGPRRYVLAAEDVAMADLARRVAGVAGFESHPLDMSPALALPFFQVVRLLASALRLRGADDYQGVWVASHYHGADTTTTTRELGVRFRPLNTTLIDTVAWLRDAGHAAKPAGRAASRA